MPDSWTWFEHGVVHFPTPARRRDRETVIVMRDTGLHQVKGHMGMAVTSTRTRRRYAGFVRRSALISVVAAVFGWLAWAAVSWLRYGHGAHTATSGDQVQRLLPDYEVVELFQTRVNAPAPVTFAAAESTSLNSSRVTRGIFRARELLLGGSFSRPLPSGGVVEQMCSMGWEVLSRTPQREIILGAVTQPWNRDVVFRGLPPEEFTAFAEPGFVKILVTIGASPIDSGTSRLQIGTYVATTNPVARERFRRYWSVFSPGILLIRALALNTIRHDAEQRQRMLPESGASAHADVPTACAD
jgi:hypothetical protein